MQKISVALGKERTKTKRYWSDSMIALGWIRGSPQRWKTFVANRVSRIQSLSESSEWYHVGTNENPADLISRGVEPIKLKESTLWWEGPTWLKDANRWPKQQKVEIDEEAKVCHQISATKKEDVLGRFSTFTRMLRVLSYCRRFILRCKKRQQEKVALTAKEIQETLHQVIKLVQKEGFEAEIDKLEKGEPLEKSNKLTILTPFVDANGILRVGGRLQYSLLLYDEKHPVILPRQHHFVTLLIRYAHQTTIHGGVQSTLAFVRRKYWLLNGKRAVSSELRKCTKCIRYKAEVSKQLMGSLPAARVVPSSPFTHTGIDYAGPIQIRTTKGRGHKAYKGYIAVFICLSTKAIHLEPVSDMTTESFLAAMKRFTARRGTCSHIYSDNGTTFVGAKNILSEVSTELAISGTEWHFIPPGAPHFGGLWEAGVKSTKYHLKRIVGDSTLTFEELTTLLYQIEACLNSRPLCALTDSQDLNDTEVLTPGHFLVGKPLLSPGNIIDPEVNTNLLSRWKVIQKMKRDFWKKWSSEYLGTLQQRWKWKIPENNIEIGRMVLVKENEINPTTWPLGKILDVHPGKDGLVRVVTVRQAKNTVKRPITKIIPLPIKEEQPAETEAMVNCIRVENKGTISSRWWLWLLVLLSICTPGNATYKIQHPPPGLYVEKIGTAQIERGVFRLKIPFNIFKAGEDATAMMTAVADLENLCNEVIKLTDEYECEDLIQHLEKQKLQFEWIYKGIKKLRPSRKARGLLGSLLTAVFGVNDEVYQDIEALQKNEESLVKASNHQAQFLISALTSFNHTEERIQQRLEHFREQLNKGIRALNEMQNWYKAIDKNQLRIHLLTAYQGASNFISEIIAYYSRLLNIHYGHGHLYDFLSPAEVEETVEHAQQKLPPNIKILSSPVLRTRIELQNESYIVSGDFPLTELESFEVMKSTPIPLKIEKNSYWVIDVPDDILAVEFNQQLYFSMTEEEWKDCVRLETYKFLCSPGVIKNLDTNPNCALQEIYHPKDENSCKVQKNAIDSLIWKEVYLQNSWLFICSKPTRVAVNCDGVREEVRLNGSGIIQVEQGCVIKTKQNILNARRISSVPVLASLSRPASFHINQTFQTQPSISPLELEPVIKVSNNLEGLQEQIRSWQEDWRLTHFNQIKHHSTWVSIGTSTMLIVLILGVVAGIHCWYRRCTSRQPKVRNTTSPTHDVMEMQPIYNQPSERTNTQDNHKRASSP